MMTPLTDIVERLRDPSHGDPQIGPEFDSTAALLHEAATEIETLRAENKALRGSELEVLRHQNETLRAAHTQAVFECRDALNEIETLRARAKIHQQVVTEEIETLKATIHDLRWRIGGGNVNDVGSSEPTWRENA